MGQIFINTEFYQIAHLVMSYIKIPTVYLLIDLP